MGGAKNLWISRFFFVWKKFLVQSAWSLENFEKFQGNWSLFGNFLKNVPKKVKFYQLFAKIIRCTKKNLRKKFKKSASVSDFKHFCHFQTPFYLGLCQYTKVKPWKIWFSKEISKFYQLFGKIQFLPFLDPIFTNFLRKY